MELNRNGRGARIGLTMMLWWFATYTAPVALGGKFSIPVILTWKNGRMLTHDQSWLIEWANRRRLRSKR